MPSTPTRLIALSVLALITAAWFVASPARAGGTDHAVEIADFAFDPATLTVTAGDTVTWTNLDAVVHTATSTTGAFDSGDLAQGQSFSRTFTKTGTYDYLCTPHPSMTGRVVVVAATATPAPSTAAAPSAPPPASGGGSLPDVAMARPEPPAALIVGIALLLIAITLGAVKVWRRRTR